jgi:hypothetical protein
MMLASAGAAAWSTYLYWLPCRGTMLEGTLIHPTVGDGRSYEEYERLDPAVKAAMRACEARMDGIFSDRHHGRRSYSSSRLRLLVWLGSSSFSAFDGG